MRASRVRFVARDRDADRARDVDARPNGGANGARSNARRRAARSTRAGDANGREARRKAHRDGDGAATRTTRGDDGRRHDRRRRDGGRGRGGRSGDRAAERDRTRGRSRGGCFDARAERRAASASANAANAFDESHKATYGVVVDGDGEIIDEVIALTFIAPRSYTAEDVVELHCHGGAVCVQRAMARCLDEGARLARNGEFTLRAFLNGRLDLTQAEAVHALVSAKTTAAADSALAAMRGGLTTPVSEARRACVDLLAELEARLDFDDEMVPLDVRAIEAKAAGARETIRKVLTTAKRGALLETGVTVAIVGRPNVGKSRLLNALTRSERSIVTSREGTTRDVVEASVNIGGLPATLLDTAGIRSETDDEVEKIGVERSRAAAAGADIVVLVVDAERGWVSEDSAIWQSEIANNARARGSSVLVVNKTDIADASNATPPPEVLESFSTVVHVSAATGDNLEHLEHAIVRTVSGGEVDAEGGAWAANQRQAEALQNALDSLDRLRDTIAADMPLDFWTIDLREAAFALGSVTGDDVTEDVLDTIFERFCIGK